MQQLTYAQSLKYIFERIPTSAPKKFPGSLGLSRMAQLLQLLDNPQNKYHSIHVAATSGKGSICYLTSSILASQGLKVGLCLSPHIRDIRERCQIDNKLLSKSKFAAYLNMILPAVEKVDQQTHGKVSYFEIITALAFFAFWKEGVKVAVLETGMGGTFDATNVITREDKLTVIGRIGLDHTAILGNTIPQIAQQKAGIIQSRNRVFTIQQSGAALQVVKDVCKKRGALLSILKPGVDFTFLRVSKLGTYFTNNPLLKTPQNIKVGLVGEHQAENCSLAIRVSLQALLDLGVDVDYAALKRILAKTRFPGRFEIKTVRDRVVVFDGAHNTQKMEALINSLKQVFPNTKFSFLIAFKHDKDISSMLELIVPVAKKIVVTSFEVEGQDFLQTSCPPKEVDQILKKLSFKNSEVIPQTKEAFLRSLNNKNLIVTGSFYLISQIYSLNLVNK